jgi:multidrug efflux system membrane fusion protein
MTIPSSPRTIQDGGARNQHDHSPLRRYGVGGAALLLVIGGFYWWTHSGSESGQRRNPTVPVQAGPVVQRDMPVVKNTIGTVVANATVSVTARVQGQLTRAYFSEGQMVKAGDLLFQIDPRPFEAALAQAQGQLAKDTASLTSAQADARRYATLFAQNAISTQQRDQSDATAKADAALVEADRGTVEAARLNLEFTQIRSPVDGKTGPILLQPGNLVSVNGTATPLVTITQIKPIKVSFVLPQSDLPAIQQRAGEGLLTAAVALHNAAAGGRTLTAPVNFVSNAVTNTGTIEMRATFPNEDAALVPGQLVDVTVQLDNIPKAVVVPRVAVINGPSDAKFVYRINESVVEKVPVTIAFDDGTDMAVTGDLRPGDNVIIDGGLRVVPGSKVVVQRISNRPAGAGRGGRGARGARGARGGETP